jgi:hypothetical protein
MGYGIIPTLEKTLRIWKEYTPMMFLAKSNSTKGVSYNFNRYDIRCLLPFLYFTW